MLSKVCGTSRSNLSWCHIARQQPQAGFVRRIQDTLECRMNADQQIAQPRQPASLLLDQVGTPANDDTNPDLEVGHLVEQAQITSSPELIGDDLRISRVAFSLSTSCSLTSAVHG